MPDRSSGGHGSFVAYNRKIAAATVRSVSEKPGGIGMSGLPAASFAQATTMACCCRSSSTLQVPAEMSSQDAFTEPSAKRSIAPSASRSNVESYGSARMRTMDGLKRSFNGHNASTTCHPVICSGRASSRGRPNTRSAKRRNRSNLFITSSPSVGCLATSIVAGNPGPGTARAGSFIGRAA